MSEPALGNLVDSEQALRQQFIERRRRMQADLDIRSVLLLAFGVLGFNVWDRWLGPEVGNFTLAIRTAIAATILIAFAALRFGNPGLWAVRGIYLGVFAVGLWGTAYALSYLPDGLLWGTAGLLIFPIGLAFFPLTSRLYVSCNLLGAAGVVWIAVAREVPWPHALNFLISYGFCFLIGTLALQVLIRQQWRLFLMQRKSAEEARTDALTGLWNRRFMADLGARQARSSRRPPQPFSVLMLDLDHFKSINDRFGHDAGDRVLSNSARVLGQSLRSVDFLGRWGGEEFLAILLDTDLTQAQRVAERCLSALANHPIDIGAQSLTVGLSIGVAQLGPGESFDSLIKRADVALYRAKADGRGRACLAEVAPDADASAVASS